jgi:HSP90 family molecular chaperone
MTQSTDASHHGIGRSKLPVSKPTLEINPAHPLLKRLEQLSEGDEFTDLATCYMNRQCLPMVNSCRNPLRSCSAEPVAARGAMTRAGVVW